MSVFSYCTWTGCVHYFGIRIVCCVVFSHPSSVCRLGMTCLFEDTTMSIDTEIETREYWYFCRIVRCVFNLQFISWLIPVANEHINVLVLLIFTCATTDFFLTSLEITFFVLVMLLIIHNFTAFWWTLKCPAYFYIQSLLCFSVVLCTRIGWAVSSVIKDNWYWI